jgi:hypothetical protein
MDRVSIEGLTVPVQASWQALFSLNREVQPSDEELPHFLLLRIVYKLPGGLRLPRMLVAGYSGGETGLGTDYREAA